MREYVKIYCCGDCVHYNWKKHKCNRGATDEGKPTDNFYRDCPIGICIDAEPVRHGKWIIEDGHVCCSECGEISKEYNWCPYCGTRMDEE